MSAPEETGRGAGDAAKAASRPPAGSAISPSMQATVDHSHDTSPTQAPLSSISLREPSGGGWAYVGAAVFILCVIVSLVLIFG